jgi:hypothetical protein
MKPGLPISMVDTSTGGMKLVTRGKVRGRALKHQQGVGINETDVKVSIQCNHNRTSMACNKNFITASKIIGTVNFLLLHLWKMYRVRALFGIFVIMSDF